MNLLTQLDVNRSKTSKVQQKSEVRYIGMVIMCNTLSHIMDIAASHYQIGTPDRRLKGIEIATLGAKALNKLIQKEN